MSDDAVLMQGRQTKRKFKKSLLLITIALLLLAAAWVAIHPQTLLDDLNTVLARFSSGNANRWITTDYGPDACSFLLENQAFFAEDGMLTAMRLDGSVTRREVTGLISPQTVVSEKAAALYDSGGKQLVVVTGQTVHTLDIPSGVDAATVSSRGETAVITAGSGYDAVTQWYDADGNILRTIGFQKEAVVLMTFFRDANTLAAVVLADGGVWNLRFYEEDHSVDIPLNVSEVYDLKPCGEGVALWCSNGLLVFSGTGNLASSLEFAPEELLLWDSSSFAAAVLLEEGAPVLVTLDETGNTFRSEPLSRTPRGLSVSASRLCVLDREALLIYDKQCRLKDSAPEGALAAHVQAIPGGAAVFGDCEFMRYIPIA